MSSLLSVLMVSTKVKQNIVKTHSIKYTHQELKINSLSEPQSTHSIKYTHQELYNLS
jgi:hypothetical protein